MAVRALFVSLFIQLALSSNCGDGECRAPIANSRNPINRLTIIAARISLILVKMFVAVSGFQWAAIIMPALADSLAMHEGGQRHTPRF